jgi:enterochelin esterase-like enzyme
MSDSNVDRQPESRVSEIMTGRWILFAAAILVISHTSFAPAQSPTPQRGETAMITIPSKIYPAGRRAWAYTPAGYPGSCRTTCNLIVAFDGGMYLGAMPMPQVLDSLIAANRTAATVAILVDNGAPPARLADLANSPRFASFVAEELVPWVREHYAVTHAADHTIIAGVSAGALEATYIAFKYPTLFGNVLSQSGAFWRGNDGSNDAPYEWLTQQFATSPKANLHLFLDVGSMETGGALGGAAPSLLDANRRLRDVLKTKGYALEYFEVPGGQHSPESWRLRLPVGIVALAPPAPPRPPFGHRGVLFPTQTSRDSVGRISSEK